MSADRLLREWRTFSVPIRQTFLRLGEAVYISFGLQSFGKLIAHRLDLLFSAMEIHLVRFQVLDLDRPGF
jgi:hypothetical protein